MNRLQSRGARTIQATTATIQVTNTGVATKDFFVDPRLLQSAFVPLLSSGTTNVPLPLVTQPSFVVPPGTDRVVVAAQGSVPIVQWAFQPAASDWSPWPSSSMAAT